MQEIDGSSCGHNIIFNNKFLSHSTPLSITTSVINSHSIFLVSYKYLFLGSHDVTSLTVENIHQIADLLSQALVIQLSFYRHFTNNKALYGLV